MRKPVVLITGAGGEIGHGLIEGLAGQSKRGIVTLDLAKLDPDIASLVDREITGSILGSSPRTVMTSIGFRRNDNVWRKTKGRSPSGLSVPPNLGSISKTYLSSVTLSRTISAMLFFIA